MRRQSGELVLIDCGAVKQVGTIISQGGTVVQTITIGTPGYMPSEQLMGKPRYRSDIYAVGMIGIQALTGILPDILQSQYENDDTGEIDWLHLADVSDDLGNILQKMIRYDYRQRYLSAAEVLEAIKAVKNNDPDLNNNLVEHYKKEGKNLIDLEKYQEAVVSFNKALEIKPDDYQAWYNRGSALDSLGRYEEAIASYDKALKITPYDEVYISNRKIAVKKLNQ